MKKEGTVTSGGGEVVGGRAGGDALESSAIDVIGSACAGGTV